MTLAPLLVSICLGVSPGVKAVEAQQRAAEALEARLAAARQGGATPRVADPAVAAELADVADERGLLAAPFTAEALGDRMDMCQRPVKVATGFLMLGFQPVPGEPQDETVRRLTDTFMRNGVAFQDELTPLLAFCARCFGKISGVLPGWAATRLQGPITAAQRDGLAQMRRGMLQVYVGALSTATERQMRPVNSRQLVRAAAEAAQNMSAIMPPADRAMVLRALATVPPTAEIGADLGSIERAMKRTDCTGLCAL